MAEPLSVYVHVPFCASKCGYCDFNSYAGQEDLIPAYSRTLVREAGLWRVGAKGRPVTTVFLGGGTPSLVPLSELRLVVEGLRASFEIEEGVELTLEANPDSADEAYLRGLVGLGFNRLSLGVQSFDDDELRALGRRHSVSDVRDAFAAARGAGFSNVSLDLIFGLPGQSMRRWQRSLEEALSLEPEHLSLYGLAVEEGTPLERDVASGRTLAPDPDAQADQYEWAEERLARGGYEHYEISNWARPGFRCLHNLTYWECREYLGLGAGAHSYLGGVRFANVASPEEYVSSVEESWREAAPSDGGAAMRQVVSREEVTPEMAMADVLILGLRLVDGLELAGFRRRFGQEVLDAFRDELQEAFEFGLIEIAGGCLRLTSRGRLLGNEVFTRLLPERCGSIDSA